MTGTRIYRGIGILASLTAAFLAPQSAASESITGPQTNIVPSRELQNELTNNIEHESNDLEVDPRHQRRELSWWGVALFFSHAPCPPGPLGKHCRDQHDSSNASGSTASGSSASSSASSGAYDGRDSYYGTDADGASYYGTDADGASEEASYLANNNGGNGNAAMLSPGSAGFWLLLVAAAAVATAIAAMVVGSRRGEEKEYHPLRGAVEKRMKLFGGFADRCMGDRSLCGDQKIAGDGGLVEMADSGEQQAQYKEMV